MKTLMPLLALVACASQPAPPIAAKSPTSAAVPLAGTNTVTDADKDLVRTRGTPALTWTAPSGAKLAIAATTRLVGTKYSIDLVVDGAVVTTVDTSVEQPNAEGWHQYEAVGGIKAIPEGVLFVAETVKVTGKAANDYDARVLRWDAAQNKLVIARSIQFGDAYDPSKDH